MSKKPTENMVRLLKESGSKEKPRALAAQREIAKALETPLRKGVLSGDIVTDIFEGLEFDPGVPTEYPLDFLAPGTEKDHVAYTIPNHGYIPERHVEGDFVLVPTFDIGNAIDWLLKYARDARWDVVNRALRVLEAGFVKKTNDDGWHTLIGAGVDRNILVFDADAQDGQFTKRLVSLMKTVMRRNSGGNSTSINRGKLTDLYMSPEANEEIRNWGVEILDEITRREVFIADDETGVLSRIFNVFLHAIDELGEGQEYQDFYGTLGGTLNGTDTELFVGLDLSSNDSFVMPIRQNLEIFEDDNLHRQRRAGLYGWKEHGFACLDNRRVILGSA
jgi:hypothetical protein